MGRGSLRIYLGAAPGVGKTYAMLGEAWRRRRRGVDVVIGFIETHGREETSAQMRDLERVPRRPLAQGGAAVEEMDIDAVLARRPQLAVVDELAHTNAPGSRNPKRWQDVDELLDAGIDVLSTLNIEHLESLNDLVERITGVKQAETIPDAAVRTADQIQLVDMTPEALRRRLAHGDVYPADKVNAALANYFRPGNLGALRELALLWVADRVDASLHDYMAAHGIDEPWETRERVLVAMTGRPGGGHLIRRAARIATRAKAELIGVHVRRPDGLLSDGPAHLERHRRLLMGLGGGFHETVAEDIATGLLQVARAEQATQIVLGSSRRSRWDELLRGSVIHTITRNSGRIDVHVISLDEQGEPDETLPRFRRFAVVPRRRRIAGLVVGAAGLPVLTGVPYAVPSDIELSSVLLLYLSLTVAAAAVGGVWPGALTAIGGLLLANWFFTDPLHTLNIADPPIVVALIVFAVVAATVSVLVELLARREAETARARSESGALSRLASTVLEADDPLHALVADLRRTFNLEAVTLLRREDGGWRVEASAGTAPARAPEDGTDNLEITADTRLVLRGPRTPADDRRILAAFAAQLALAQSRQQLQHRAADADALAESNRLRTALLQAVSHDLRTPLASIKASATSLLQDDVEWTPRDTRAFVTAIVDDTDRLNTLVGNLLDLSRLQTGALETTVRPVGLDEVVPAALASLGARADHVEADVPESLPRVVADPALLERVVANLVDNAITWSPPGAPVRIQAGQVHDRIDLRILDRGPGIPATDHEQVFQPFQRVGDRASDTGVGLGLAVARGFTEAIRGQLSIEDTPGGGTTMVLSLAGVPLPTPPARVSGATS